MVSPRSYTWQVPEPLDQGSEGACVGFGFAHELAARPVPIAGITNDYAFAIYHWARQHDEWPGENYDGTSVLAGAKAVSEWLALITEYRWAFSLDDVVRTIAYRGPVILGCNWWTGMMRPESDGRIRPSGVIEGGHCILAPRHTGERYGIKEQRRRVYVYNSWGYADRWPWAWLTYDDFERVLLEAGEACVPVIRKRSP